MAGGLDSATAAVIGAAVGAGVSLIVAALDRGLEALHDHRERARATRAEVREALTEMHRALALAGNPETPDKFAAAAANDLALARLGLLLPRSDQPIVAAARSASIAAMERADDTAAKVGIFRDVSGAWFRGETTAERALELYTARTGPARR